MKEKVFLSLREIQLAEYEILTKLVRYFEQNNIHYVLCGGTLLGAVRHNGFIPWDDDIDIFVPREDFERLKVLYQRGSDSLEGIRLLIPGEKGYPYPFIKAQNEELAVIDEKRDEKYQGYVWADVFSLDHFPDNSFLHRLYYLRIHMMTQILSFGTLSDTYLKKRGYYSKFDKIIVRLLLKTAYTILGGSTKIARRIDRIACRMDKKYKISKHVGNGAWPNGMRDYYLVSDMEPITKHVFERGEFNIPENYDSNLTCFYGDYMKIPPVEERADHCFTAYRVK